MKKKVIRFKSVGKKYVVNHEKPTLVENILGKGTKSEFWALKNVDMTIYKGDRVGIIGSNGAGKTTLLELISGITKPTEGRVEVDGRVVSLIDLEAGFHPELTGEENLYLNGMLLGLSKKKLKERSKEIIDFSGIKEFIDAPLYTYSTGMKLRLGFSVAVFSDPDILVLDENIGVGDKVFQEQAKVKINELIDSGITFVLVSHIEGLLKTYCKKFFWLQKADIHKQGSVAIVNEYFGR